LLRINSAKNLIGASAQLHEILHFVQDDRMASTSFDKCAYSYYHDLDQGFDAERADGVNPQNLMR